MHTFVIYLQLIPKRGGGAEYKGGYIQDTVFAVDFSADAYSAALAKQKEMNDETEPRTEAVDEGDKENLDPTTGAQHMSEWLD